MSHQRNCIGSEISSITAPNNRKVQKLDRENNILRDQEFDLQNMADAAEFAAPAADEELIIDVDGFEGPLDLLLALARTHKLDISKISILELVEQYLEFITNARNLKLQIAGDYLVMAAWLAFLKSKLLLPKEGEDNEPTGEELAALLAFRLKRLDAMRDAAAQLMRRDRLGRDFFARGMPEHTKKITTRKWDASIYDLLKSYSRQRQATVPVKVTIRARKVWSIKEARKRLEEMLGVNCDWSALQHFLKEYFSAGKKDSSALASTFGATLEMARDGLIEIKQTHAFAPLYLRRKGDVEWKKTG